jgi:ACT domain-containing protein
MIKNITIGEELTITAENKIGILADISKMLANKGINIEAVLGYEIGKKAKLLLVTNANIVIVKELKKMKYRSVKETEVLLVDLSNKPGSLKVVSTEMKENKIDIKYIYLTPCTCATKGSSRMVLQTSDNEKAMAVLAKYIAG